ncbi:MAG TPA: hypothetical protein VN972_01385, partial [Methylomirabilota bacterium]|nr:hypothetical protein [Methylomirabilota bacterium]
LDVPGFLAESKLQDGGASPSLEARVRRLVSLLGRVEDPIRRRLLLRRGAEVFGLEESVLLEAAQDRGRGRKPAGKPPAGSAASVGTRTPAAGTAQASGAQVPQTAGVGSQASEAEPSPTDPVERELAGRVLTEEGALTEVAAEGGAICFRNGPLRRLLEPWLGQGRPPREDELRLLEAESPLIRELLYDLFPEPGKSIEVSRREARDLIQRLEERRLKASIQALDQAIREAERSRDEGSLGRLIAERRDLASKLHTRSSQPAIH